MTCYIKILLAVIKYYRQASRYSWSSSATRTFTSTDMKMKTLGE